MTQTENKLNKNLFDYLKFYFALDNPQFAILIKGKWGSGKTFFIKKQIEEWNQKSTRENTRSITLKPIYISLYGVKTKEEINTKIKEALNPLLYSKGAKIVKGILFGAIKTATQINLDTNKDGKNDGNISFDINSIGLLKSNDSKIKGNKLLIFDDIERCSIKVDDLFGYINEFVEHFNCKVILLSDEGKIYEDSDTDRKRYDEFKEKLISQTFTIQPNINEAINSFIKISKSSNTDFLNSSVELIKSVFTASGIENLRILKQSILDFGRFTLQFDKKIIENKQYSDFLTNLLFHFLLVYLEYKSGNKKITCLTNSYLLSDEQKSTDSVIRTKYDVVFREFNIYHRTYVLEYGLIAYFIENGYSNTIQLHKSLKQNRFFRDSEIMDWEKLWGWEELDDADFDKIYTNVLIDFNNSKFRNPYILFHVLTILLSLIEKNIVRQNKKHLIDSFKKQIVAILSSNTNTPFSLIGEHFRGKEYRGFKNDEIKSLHAYINEKIKIHNSQAKDDYLKSVFETLDDENIYHLQEKLDKSLPDNSTTYNNVSILSTVNGEALGDRLLKLKINNLSLFFAFLRQRYYPEKRYSNLTLEAYNADDKECLQKLKTKFETELSNLKRIKRYNLSNHIIFINEIIEKLNNLNSNKNK